MSLPLQIGISEADNGWSSTFRTFC